MLQRAAGSSGLESSLDTRRRTFGVAGAYQRASWVAGRHPRPARRCASKDVTAPEEKARLPRTSPRSGTLWPRSATVLVTDWHTARFHVMSQFGSSPVLFGVPQQPAVQARRPCLTTIFCALAAEKVVGLDVGKLLACAGLATLSESGGGGVRSAPLSFRAIPRLSFFRQGVFAIQTASRPKVIDLPPLRWNAAPTRSVWLDAPL